MQIKKRKKNKFVIVSLKGSMEVYDAERFENTAMEIIKKGQKNIIINFQELEYISSSGLRALLNIRGRLLERGGRLLLVSLKEKVLEVFRVSRLLDMFDVYKDVEEATKL